MNAKTARRQMEAIIEARTTEQLFADLITLDTHRNTDGMLPLEEQRIVNSTITDIIATRHNLNDALDAIYADETWYGTSREALRLALTKATKADPALGPED